MFITFDGKGKIIKKNKKKTINDHVNRLDINDFKEGCIYEPFVGCLNYSYL